MPAINTHSLTYLFIFIYIISIYKIDFLFNVSVTFGQKLQRMRYPVTHLAPCNRRLTLSVTGRVRRLHVLTRSGDIRVRLVAVQGGGGVRRRSRCQSALV